MTTNQIPDGVGLILALTVGSQVLASRLRIPAVIVLLSAGFVAGALPTAAVSRGASDRLCKVIGASVMGWGFVPGNRS